MKKSTKLFSVIFLITILIVGTLYFWPDTFHQINKTPNRIVVVDNFSQANDTEQLISSTGKTITMVFTRSKSEYSGMWTYLIFNEAFKILGMELLFENYPPERCSFLSDHGKVDGELSRVYYYNETHPNLIRVEEPLSSINWVAYTTDSAIRIDGWESLRDTDYKVEYRKGLLQVENQLHGLLKEKNISFVGSISQGLRKLASGRTDIYIDVEETVTQYLLSEEFKGIGILKSGVLENVPLHAFLHKKNASYVQELSSVLKKMKQEGLFEKYIVVAEHEIGSTALTNHLENGGFEEVEDIFEHWEFIGPKEVFVLDHEIHSGGKNSIQFSLQQNSGDGVSLIQELEVEAGMRYEIGGNIKTSLQNGFAKIGVIFLDRNRNEIARHFLPQVIDDKQWDYQNMWIKSPNGADKARIICYVQGRGQVWFDDIYYTKKIRGGY